MLVLACCLSLLCIVCRCLLLLGVLHTECSLLCVLVVVCYCSVLFGVMLLLLFVGFVC